jgi:hypothetical protein
MTSPISWLEAMRDGNSKDIMRLKITQQHRMSSLSERLSSQWELPTKGFAVTGCKYGVWCKQISIFQVQSCQGTVHIQMSTSTS